MSYYFASFQISELAMQIEDAGAKFYHSLADKTESEALKNIFLTLQKQELEHKEVFMEIRNVEKEKNDTAEFQIDLYSQMKIAVDELREGTFNLEKVPGPITDINQALDLGIRAEKDSIAVYSQMQNQFIEKFHPILNRIIDQEKDHLKRLEKIRKEMNK